MAEYKLPGSYCKTARDEITNLVLNRMGYGDDVNVYTEPNFKSDLPCYFITVVAPNVEQDELIEKVNNLIFTAFDDTIYRYNDFLSRCFDDFKKSCEYEQFKTYIINNQGIKAIKLVRDYTHCGLKEAHEFWKKQKEGYDKIGYFPA